jgi:hypothetical protein
MSMLHNICSPREVNVSRLPPVTEFWQKGGIKTIGIFGRTAVIFGLQLGTRDKPVGHRKAETGPGIPDYVGGVLIQACFIKD